MKKILLIDDSDTYFHIQPKNRTCEPFRVNGFWVIFTDPETGIVLVDILTRYVRKICAG